MCKRILFVTVSHISPCLTHARNIRYLLYEIESTPVREQNEETLLKNETILEQRKFVSVII